MANPENKQGFIIVGSDGTEHPFPAGTDVQSAIASVKQKESSQQIKISSVQTPQAPAPSAKPGTLDFIKMAEQTYPGPFEQAAIGAGKSLASHVINFANWLGGMEAIRATPLGFAYEAKKVLDAAAKAKDPAVKDAAAALTPYLELSNPQQKIGGFLESILEVAAPGGPVSKTANIAGRGIETALPTASRLVRRLGNVAGQAVVEGAVGGAQNVAQGGDFSTGAALGAAVPAALQGGKALFTGVKNIPAATTEALNYMRNIGANVPAGIATDLAPLKFAQQGLENVSVASALAGSKAKRKTAIALTEEGRRLSELAGAGVSTESTKSSAGSAIAKELKQNYSSLKAHSSALYNEISEAVKSGNVESVDLAAARPALQTLVDDSQHEVQQILASSPNAPASDINKVLFLAKKFLELPDKADIVQVDNVLKDIKRMQASESVSSNTRRLLGMVIDPIEQSLQQAAEASGLGKTLQTARSTWRRAKDIEDYADVLTSGNEKEKAKIANSLLDNYDKSLDVLKQLKEYAPSSIPELAQSWMSDAIQASIAPETGYIQKVGQLQSAWKNLGPESKKILFGPAAAKNPRYIENVTNFVNGAFLLGRELNPSGSGYSIGTLAHLTAFVFKSLATAGFELSSAMVTKMLRSPKFVKLLTEGASLESSAASTSARMVIRQKIMDEINLIREEMKEK